MYVICINTTGFHFRMCDGMEQEEHTERDRFLEECIQDPSLRDKMSILSRTFQNRKNVSFPLILY